MHVLRLTPVFAPPDSALSGRAARSNPVGGVQNSTAALTRALDGLGVRQTVVTSRPPTAPVIQRYGEHARVLRLGLPVRRSRGMYAPLAGLAAPALASRADVVHLHFCADLGMAPVAGLAARLAGVPLVVTLHGSLRHTLLADSAYAARLRDYGGAVEGWAVRRADAVVTLTERLAATLVAEGVDPEAVHAIPSGVDPAVFAAPPGGWPDPYPHLARPRVVYVGRLDPEKDVATLVAALALLRARSAQLLIVGDGGERARLEKLAADLGVAERVWTVGFVPHAAVPAVLAHADALVLPSRFEELGTALLEALHAGVPVVASRVGGIPEVLRDGRSGLLVDPGRPEQFADALDRVLAAPELAARLAAAARVRAADYAWPALAQRVLAVYRDLAPASPRSPGSPRPVGSPGFSESLEAPRQRGTRGPRGRRARLR